MYLVQAGFLIENPPLLQPLSFIFINVALIVSLRYELAKLHVLTSYSLLHLCVLRGFTFISELTCGIIYALYLRAFKCDKIPISSNFKVSKKQFCRSSVRNLNKRKLLIKSYNKLIYKSCKSCLTIMFIPINFTFFLI